MKEKGTDGKTFILGFDDKFYKQEDVLTIDKYAVGDVESYLLIDATAVSDTTFEEIVEGFKNNKISIVKSSPSLQEAVEVLCNALREDENKNVLKECLNKEWDLPYHENPYIKYMEASYTAFNNFLNLLISK